MRLRPTFTVSSPRPVWRQVVRGLAIFAIGAVVLLAGSVGVTEAKRAWDHRQETRRWHAELASEGIAEVCHGGVSDDCARTAASKAKAEVAYVDDSDGYMWASVGTQDFRAYETGLVGTIWSQPRLTAEHSEQYRVARTVMIDRMSVTLWTWVPSHHCGCSPAPTTAPVTRAPLVARATWNHDGHRYELATFFGDDPTAKLTQTFRAIRYATPSR